MRREFTAPPELVERPESIVQVPDMSAECAFGESAVDQVVCATPFFRERHLSLDSLECCSTCQTVSFLKAGNLGFTVCGHDDGLIDAFVDPGFEQERYFIDDDCTRLAFDDLSDESLFLASNPGMDDAFESAELGPVAKHDGSQCMAVQ